MTKERDKFICIYGSGLGLPCLFYLLELKALKQLGGHAIVRVLHETQLSGPEDTRGVRAPSLRTGIHSH